MASSYFTESEAPRDFRISSTDSDGHYTKCLLCYTVKRNFYCSECVRNGNFIHSSMPYSDRFSEKQGKLLRLKANRKHILDRCEKLLSHKLKRDILLIESKQSRDKLDLLRLAIDQRRNNIDEKKKQLAEIKQQNSELSAKLPRYQKRVSSLGKHVLLQAMELQNKMIAYNDQSLALSALRQSRIRQLTKYIFPVYMSYDSSDSIEDMEFVGEDAEEELPKRSQLHIVAPWLNADGDFSQVHAWLSQNKEATLGAVSSPTLNPAHRTGAALGLAAQLTALLAWLLDVRLPDTLSLSEYCNWHVSRSGLGWRVRRLCAAVAALCVRSGVMPPGGGAAGGRDAAGGGAAGGALQALHTLALLAAAPPAPPPYPAPHHLAPALSWGGEWATQVEAAWAAAALPPDDADNADDAEPEHLHWPETLQIEDTRGSPPAPPASLVTSAAASLASMWRGWTK